MIRFAPRIAEYIKGGDGFIKESMITSAEYRKGIVI
jgi:hypothetical protein